MMPSGPLKYRKIAVDWGAARPHLDLEAVVLQEVPAAHDVVDRGDLEVDVREPGVLVEHGELGCTGSKRIRQAVWPIQSETFMVKCRVQKRRISATSGASTPMWPNSVVPAARPKRTGRLSSLIWPSASRYSSSTPTPA